MSEADIWQWLLFISPLNLKRPRCNLSKMADSTVIIEAIADRPSEAQCIDAFLYGFCAALFLGIGFLALRHVRRSSSTLDSHD